MTCKSCAERRKALREKREAKRLARKHFQAAAIGAVLAVSEAAGKVLGIGEDKNEERSAPVSDEHGREAREE